jgi:hypothetical protein
VVPDLGDYSKIREDSDLVLALKEGLKEAQTMLRGLNMAPSSVAMEKRWFLEPWVLKGLDPKCWTFVQSKTPAPSDDGNGEALREALVATAVLDFSTTQEGEGMPHLEGDVHEDFDDGLDLVSVAENECRDALSELMDQVEPPLDACESVNEPRKMVQTVEYNGKCIYKSTLVLELNGNPFLSKDRLTRVRNSIYFNNSEDYLFATSSSTAMLLGVGSDCWVFFLQRHSRNISSTVKAAQHRSKCGKSRKGAATRVSSGGDVGSWW